MVSKTDMDSVFVEQGEDKTQIHLCCSTAHLVFDIRYLEFLVIYLHICLVPYRDGKFIEGGGTWIQLCCIPYAVQSVVHMAGIQ